MPRIRLKAAQGGSENKQVRSIIVYAPNWIGDAVLSLPALRALRAEDREAKLSVLTRPAVRDFYDVCEDVDETIPYEPKNGMAEFWATVRQLRERRFG